MALKNKLGEWMHGNKTWTIPPKDGEGYIEELENNSSVLGLMDGKSATMKLHKYLFYLQPFLIYWVFS